MTATRPDPLAVLAAEPPCLPPDLLRAAIAANYALDVVEATSLVSERDQNLRLETADRRRYVLKIANAAELPEVTDFQIQALLHVEDYQRRHHTRIEVPRIVRTRAGRASIELEHAGDRHIARIVTYVEGTPLGHSNPDERLCRSIGRCLAELGNALRGFAHEGANQSLLWDLQQAPYLRKLLRHIPQEALRSDVAKSLDDFERRALPAFSSLRRQVIHNDFNPDNILVDARQESMVGVIDFGDMVDAPLIADVAVAASYMRPPGDPLSGICAFLGAYHAVTPLAAAETDLLLDLVRTRMAATIVLRYWRASHRSADDPYLRQIEAESSAEEFLRRLDALDARLARARFREILGAAGDQPLL